MKYKVGDKVRIKSKEWYESNRNKNGEYVCDGLSFTDYMTKFCGKEATIIYCDEDDRAYELDIDDFCWFNDGMLEDSTLDNAEKPHISEQLIKDIAEVIKSHNLGVSVSENEGKLIIEPIKANDDLPIDTPCMVSANGKKWYLRFYAGLRSCFCDGKKSSNYDSQTTYGIIIPFDKFDPNDIEKSLKYNIVK